MRDLNNYVTESIVLYKDGAIEEQSSMEEIGAVLLGYFSKKSARKGDR